MEMTTEAVLSNLKGYALFDVKDYKLNRYEAEICVKALENYKRYLDVLECVNEFAVMDAAGIEPDYKRFYERVREIL